MDQPLLVEDWGLVGYQQALEKQLDLVDRVASGESPDMLVICTHPPVVTLGRGTQPEDVFGWKGELIETSRGGRATYHGPNQIVMYPILNLNKNRKSFASRDLHGYLRALEAALVAALQNDLPEVEARTVKPVDGGPSLTGVWVGERKVASIGVAVKKWVTYHGVALNVSADENAFQGINPCGFQTSIMTSFEEEVKKRGQPYSPELRQQLQAKLKQCLISYLL